MNLKESFRYQNFLDSMHTYAIRSIINREHSLTITKTHLRNKANPDAEDFVENVAVEPFYKNDDVMSFLRLLVEEKMLLTQKITEAKATIKEIDLDAAVESNKFRQSISEAIRKMTNYSQLKTLERGCDYVFNVEGNQVMYYYDIEVENKEAYDKGYAKSLMKSLISDSDHYSSLIDAALINTVVDYTPKFDVNDSFEDVMETYLEKTFRK